MKKIPSALLCAAALVLCRPGARAAGELQLAREAAATGAKAKALETVMAGLGKPADRELFLYAVELLPEGRSKYSDRVAQTAQEMIKSGPEDYAWYLGACKALRCSLKLPEALANCKKAMELDPTAYPAYRELGLTYAALDNPRKAAETLAQGVEISSASCQAHYNLARALEARGDVNRAAASYARAFSLAKAGRDPDAKYYYPLIVAGARRTELAKKKAAARIPEPAGPDRRQLAAACMENFKNEFLKDNPGTALALSENCLRLSPSDPALAAGRAPLLVRLGKYESGIKEYERAAGLYAGKGSMQAFLRIKAAETWLKLGNPAQALAYYKLALAANPGDMNALKGLAAAQESRSDFPGALETYGAILKKEPGNEKIRTRCEELKAGLLTNDQIMSELKLRLAIEAGKALLQPEDIKLFKAIKSAEINGAVDYLKTKPAGLKGLTVEIKRPEGPRVLLTGTGYKAYIFHTTRDAIKFFEGSGIGLREVFQLRDLSGSPIFDPGGKLTPEGEEAWRKAEAGAKTWLLPYDPVPESPQAVKAAKDTAEAAGKGYREISEPEYLWLLRATDCPEDVLKAPPIDLLTVSDGARIRYLICYMENAVCMNTINQNLPSYIESYRNGHTDISDSKTSTAFFGSGGVKKKRLCENGKLWDGQ